MVDTIRVGTQGYALIVGEDGRLIAHGNPDEKRHIADVESERAPRAELKFAARVPQDGNASRRPSTTTTTAGADAGGRPPA